jgi:hypothetical protein
MDSILEPLLKAGGVTGLVIGVFFLLYRQVLSLGIFSTLGSKQTFAIVSMVAILVWSVAMSALFFGKDGAAALVAGNGNSVQQNIGDK